MHRYFVHGDLQRHLLVTNSAFHPTGVGKWGPASVEKEKAGVVHSVSGWTRGVQVKLWDPLRTRAIPERLRTRRGTIQIHVYLTLPYKNYWQISRQGQMDPPLPMPVGARAAAQQDILKHSQPLWVRLFTTEHTKKQVQKSKHKKYTQYASKQEEIQTSRHQGKHHTKHESLKCLWTSLLILPNETLKIHSIKYQ